MNPKFPFVRSRLIAILVFIIFFNFFLFRRPGPVAFGLVTLGQFLFLTFTFKSFEDNKTNYLPTAGVFAGLSLMCIGILLRANEFVQIILVMSVFATIGIYSYIKSSGIPMVRSLFELILAPVYFAGTYIKTFFRSFRIIYLGDYKEVVPEKSQGGKGPLIQSLIIGLAIGLFVIGILVSMLTSADPIFASFVKSIVSADFLQNLLSRIILSSILAVILMPFLFLRRSNIFNSPIGFFKKINFVNEMTIVMTLVALVIGLFLIIQWPYVFVTVPFETDLSKFGVATYSEYVKKGFGELLKISLFVYGLIWSGLVILRDNKSNGKNILKYIQVFVLAEFFIFQFSIFRRVWLYQTYHGWSMGRIYGSFLLIWILGITVFLALRHLRTKRWVIGEMVFTALLLFAIGIINIESFIVNSHPPTVNKKIDYVYLSRLSADGYSGWEKAYEYAKNVIDKYEKTDKQLDREERKEIAYAGLIIRELSTNYKSLIALYGTNEVMKQYLLEIYTYQRNANYEMYVQPGYAGYISGQNNYLNEMKDNIEKGNADYRRVLGAITLPKNEVKYKFSMGSSSTAQSFYEFPYRVNPNLIGNEKELNKDSYLDRLYIWNRSKYDAYKDIVKSEKQSGLLQLQGRYFNLYMRILSQPPNQRDYDMDISLNSPMMD